MHAIAVDKLSDRGDLVQKGLAVGCRVSATGRIVAIEPIPLPSWGDGHDIAVESLIDNLGQFNRARRCDR